MRPDELTAVRARWREIVEALDNAGIPKDDLSALAIMMGGQLLADGYARLARRETRPIGFAPPTRKE
jgi:hypothetical protein